MRVAIYTLGCKVNTYESEKISSDFLRRGARIVPFESPADLIVVNTCSVTQMADKKSRQILHRARRNNPDAFIVVTGCYSQKKPADLPKDAVDFVVYNQDKDHFAEIVMQWLEEEKHLDPVSASDVSDSSVPASLTKAESRISEHTRAFLKIQDGCRQYCSYCIIPYVRGPLVSLPQKRVLSEAAERISRGFREVVLTGIHLSSYGRKGTFEDPEEETTLAELICRLSEIKELERIRLGSLEPGIISDEFLARTADQKKLCPHFHLSLQSGCADTLKRMNRHYTPQEYRRAVEKIRKIWPDAAITTDVIVGFPGETEEEFEESAAFLQEIGFSQIHVFKYSPREGTAAAKRSGAVSESIKNERSEKLIELGKKMAQDYSSSWVDREAEVLLEEKGENGWVGYTRHYLRVTAVEAEKKSEEKSWKCGDLVHVRIKKASADAEGGLFGMEEDNHE